MSITTMRIADILPLRSVDGCGTTEDVLTTKYVDGAYYVELRRVMNKYGPDSIPPIEVHWYRDCQEMGNGHHRLKIAAELGWEFIRVTDDSEESGYNTEFNSAGWYREQRRRARESVAA